MSGYGELIIWGRRMLSKKKKEKMGGKQMRDELPWCVSHNTPYWFLTGVINRICEAKLMKVNAINCKARTTCTHRRRVDRNVDLLFHPFKRVRCRGEWWHFYARFTCSSVNNWSFSSDGEMNRFAFRPDFIQTKLAVWICQICCRKCVTMCDFTVILPNKWHVCLFYFGSF